MKTESESGKLTVTGEVDPAKLRETLAEKTKKKVELVSPQPKKENKNKSDDDKNKEKKSSDEKKPKEVKLRPLVTTILFLYTKFQ